MKKLLVSLVCLIALKMQGSDIRAAYIRSQWISGFSYSLTVVVLTDPSQNINRPTIPINYGDGNSGTFSLTSSASINGLTLKYYSGTHTYSGTGIYYPNYTDTFRVQGIKNIPSSQTQQMYVTSTIYVNNISSPNSSPVITNTSYSLFVSGNQINFNPRCIDADGDSLSFALTPCTAYSYYIPGGVSVNSTSGTVSFSRDSIGLYAFSFKVTEYRKNQSNIYQVIGVSQVDFVMEISPNASLNEISLYNPDFMVYPNPSSGIINIISISEHYNGAFLTIHDDMGKPIYKVDVANQDFLIDITAWADGVYYLKISKGKSNKNLKIVKSSQ